MFKLTAVMAEVASERDKTPEVMQLAEAQGVQQLTMVVFSVEGAAPLPDGVTAEPLGGNQYRIRLAHVQSAQLYALGMSMQAEKAPDTNSPDWAKWALNFVPKAYGGLREVEVPTPQEGDDEPVKVIQGDPAADIDVDIEGLPVDNPHKEVDPRHKAWAIGATHGRIQKSGSNPYKGRSLATAYDVGWAIGKEHCLDDVFQAEEEEEPEEVETPDTDPDTDTDTDDDDVIVVDDEPEVIDVDPQLKELGYDLALVERMSNATEAAIIKHKIPVDVTSIGKRGGLAVFLDGTKVTPKQYADAQVVVVTEEAPETEDVTPPTADSAPKELYPASWEKDVTRLGYHHAGLGSLKPDLIFKRIAECDFKPMLERDLAKAQELGEGSWVLAIELRLRLFGVVKDFRAFLIDLSDRGSIEVLERLEQGGQAREKWLELLAMRQSDLAGQPRKAETPEPEKPEKKPKAKKPAPPKAEAKAAPVEEKKPRKTRTTKPDTKEEAAVRKAIERLVVDTDKAHGKSFALRVLNKMEGADDEGPLFHVPGKQYTRTKMHRNEWGRCSYTFECTDDGGYKLIDFAGNRKDLKPGMYYPDGKAFLQAITGKEIPGAAVHRYFSLS